MNDYIIEISQFVHFCMIGVVKLVRLNNGCMLKYNHFAWNKLISTRNNFRQWFYVEIKITYISLQSYFTLKNFISCWNYFISRWNHSFSLHGVFVLNCSTSEYYHVIVLWNSDHFSQKNASYCHLKISVYGVYLVGIFLAAYAILCFVFVIF